MVKYFITDKTITYNGEQLTSLFNYRESKELGDSIVAFKGEMNVTPQHMVDIEDVISNDYIYSPSAINFIIELFDISLESTVLYQRAFMSIIKEVLNQAFFKNSALIPYYVELDGDDIFIEYNSKPRAKLSVSIATVSKVSGLIHTGLNLELNEKIPVLAASLSEIFSLQIQNTFIAIVMEDFVDFVTDIKKCKCKVLGV